MTRLQKAAAAGFAVAAAALFAAAGPVQNAGTERLVKPDLLVEKIEFSPSPASGGGTQLTIRYTLYNDSAAPTRNSPTPAGKSAWSANPVNNFMFEAKIQVRDAAGGPWQDVATVGLELGAHGRMTCNAVCPVPAGKRKDFRAIADWQNWIDESNENNNDKVASWPVTLAPARVSK